MSYTSQPTNSQSLNGIITLTDGVVTIEDGVISGLTELELTDLQVSDTATIENLVVNNQINMTSGKITNLANGTNANDAVNKSQLDLKADTTYVDTNFLNKTTATTQIVNSNLNMNTTNKIINLANGSNSNDAVNKSQLDLKADTTYVDTNFLNKTTATTQIVNSNLDMNTTNKIINLANGSTSNDAVNKSQLDLKADTTYVDTNFLNKTTGTTQIVASRLTFNNTTSGQSNPTIELTNAITGSNNGMYLQFFKNFNRLPNTEIGSIVFADKAVSSQLTKRAVQLTASIDNTTNPVLNITFDGGNFNPLTINNTETILRNNDFYIKNKTTLENLLYYTSSNDFWGMSKSLNMTTNNITNVNNLTINTQIDMTDGKIINLANPTLAQDASTKYYTDNQSANTNYLKRDGSLAMTGGLNMGTTNKITNLANPTLAQDAATKYYTDNASVNTNYLKRDGSLAMLGAIDMNTSNKISNLAEPTLAQDASTKYYTDNASVNTNYLKRDGSLAMTGALNMGTTHKIINLAEPVSAQDASTKYYTDNHSNNQNYLLRDGSLPMLGSLDMGSNNITIGTTNHLAFYNSDLTEESGVKMYFDRSAGSLGRFLIDMRGSEIQIRTDASSEPTSERVKINNSETTINNNLICNGNVTLGNNPTGDTTTINSVAAFNGTTTLNDDVLVSGTNKLSFNNNDLSSANANGMLMRHNGSVGFLDVRGNEFRIRTSSTGTPNTIRFKVNDENTSVINNFFVDGNTTLGNAIGNDTTTFNSKANFPSGSELKFNANSALIFQTGSSTTFASGSNTNFQDGANLTFSSNSLYLSEADIQYYNVQIFQPGSYIDGARINLISKTSDFGLDYLTNFENGCICNHTSGTLNITMPNTGGASGQYWRRRNYIIKVRETTVKLKRNTTTISTKIDELTGDVTYTTDYKTINLVFDENYHENGQIWIISDR
jgi:hypothetical protein